jgi:hypothetical protein
LMAQVPQSLPGRTCQLQMRSLWLPKLVVLMSRALPVQRCQQLLSASRRTGLQWQQRSHALLLLTALLTRKQVWW